MRKLIILSSLTLLFAFASCSPKRNISKSNNSSSDTSVSSTKDGSSFDKAIFIKEKNETSGIAAEYAWIKKNLPGYATKSQALVYHDKKPFDILEIENAAGETKKIYFDISNFFGKF